VPVQEAKAAAMGPRRNRAAAREVLAEPLLSVILDQAAQAQDAGWFWTYDLKHAKVGKARQVTMMAPGTAIASALQICPEPTSKVFVK